jgi:hypothetical protein
MLLYYFVGGMQFLLMLDDLGHLRIQESESLRDLFRQEQLYLTIDDRFRICLNLRNDLEISLVFLNRRTALFFLLLNPVQRQGLQPVFLQGFFPFCCSELNFIFYVGVAAIRDDALVIVALLALAVVS